MFSKDNRQASILAELKVAEKQLLKNLEKQKKAIEESQDAHQTLLNRLAKVRHTLAENTAKKVPLDDLPDREKTLAEAVKQDEYDALHKEANKVLKELEETLVTVRGKIKEIS